eukprot:487640-Rhodomonas_salina.1
MASKNFFASLGEDDDDHSSGHDFEARTLPLTGENLRRQNTDLGTKRRDDETQSVASDRSTLSAASYLPSPHASHRLAERKITREQIENAKMHGAVSISVRIQEQDSIFNIREEILGWGTRLKEAFPQLELQNPEVRGASQLTDIDETGEQANNPGGMRLQMAVHAALSGGICQDEGERVKEPGDRENARLGRILKKWLTRQGFFKNKSRRIMYRHQNLVVVE